MRVFATYPTIHPASYASIPSKNLVILFMASRQTSARTQTAHTKGSQRKIMHLIELGEHIDPS